MRVAEDRERWREIGEALIMMIAIDCDQTAMGLPPVTFAVLLIAN
jgi:hypothetical protein